MVSHRNRCFGYSLIELLVVLAIVGILVTVGVTMIGNRPAGAVRQTMDELEGTLMGAQKAAVATGQDIMLVSTGEWDAANPLILAYGSASLGSAAILTNGKMTSESFRLAVAGGGVGLRREHLHAGVVTAATAGWWTTAKSGGNADIVSVAPFNDANSGFKDVLTANPNLFQGGTAANGTVRISGTNKRFTTTFWIAVVGVSNGQPIVGGPMGLLVVQANGASVYKFYNPGIASGGTWRRM
jgi:prepilin-type N-terminal cleavage/methylation domain-containing protein